MASYRCAYKVLDASLLLLTALRNPYQLGRKLRVLHIGTDIRLALKKTGQTMLDGSYSHTDWPRISEAEGISYRLIH